MHLNSAGDKLPESTGEDDSTPLGKLFRLHWENFNSTGVPCILPGSILILFQGILRLPGISSLFSADGRSTLLGESIVDSSQLQVLAGRTIITVLLCGE